MSDNVNNKARYWWAVLYPENMIDDWQDKISDLVQLPFSYCIHDKDIDSASGQRKVHIHLIIAFKNTTTYKAATAVFALLNASGKKAFNKIERIIDIRHAYDYLIHDTEDCRKKGKFQYDPKVRICGNNFDIGAFEQVSVADKAAATKELANFLLDNEFDNFTLFFEAALNAYPNNEAIFEVLTTRSGFLERLCKGNWFKKHDNLNDKG